MRMLKKAGLTPAHPARAETRFFPGLRSESHVSLRRPYYSTSQSPRSFRPCSGGGASRRVEGGLGVIY
jgi:hypothetical protein